ncbi:hypothetical protein GCM10022419_071930 [Nonomuraea rosea]|uniref:Uncharacterized protein n=1 Tax=Nonomuraea rosea TaxID=638574 RepID=A0ABP6YBY0_9ACTN
MNVVVISRAWRRRVCGGAMIDLLELADAAKLGRAAGRPGDRAVSLGDGAVTYPSGASGRSGIR